MSEEQRLESLGELQLLDTPPEERFERIVRTLTRLYNAPMSFLGLVGAERVWLKAQVGLPVTFMPREESFGHYAIEDDGVLCVEDARKDTRFAHHPWVAGPPFVRFCCAIPLFGPRRMRVGILGIMDLQPRQMSAQDFQALRDVAVWATREINFPVLQKAPTRHIDSEVRMRAVLNNVQDGIVTLDVRGKIESFNPAAEKIFLCKAKDVVGANIMTMMELGTALGQRLSSSAGGSHSSISLGSMIDGEVTGRRGDGSTFPMEISLSEMYVGKQRMFTAIVRDITARKQVETQLQESEERYRDLFENAHDLIHIMSMNGRFLYVNRAWREALGYPHDDLASLSLSSIIVPACQTPFVEYMERVKQGEDVDNIQSSFLSRYGQQIDVEGSITGKREDGKIVSMRCIFHDITERKKIERMKQEFISVVSHELRTPLTSICGSLGLLSGGVFGDFPPKAISMINIAYQNSQRLVRLINDILDIEKIESGKMEFHIKPIALMPLLEMTIEANEGYAKEHKTRFVIVESIPYAVVEVDHDRIVQVVTNLLSNAAKFSPEGEDVGIAVTQGESFYRVSVIDRGPGIPEEFRGRIFTKFAQADASTTRHKGGTGLGLSICKELIEHMKGSIHFGETEGGGTTFFFDLPISIKSPSTILESASGGE